MPQREAPLVVARKRIGQRSLDSSKPCVLPVCNAGFSGLKKDHAYKTFQIVFAERFRSGDKNEQNHYASAMFSTSEWHAARNIY